MGRRLSGHGDVVAFPRPPAMSSGDPEVRAEVERLTAEIIPQARAEAYRVWQRAPHALELDELTSLALSGLAHAAARWETYCAEKGHDPHAFEYFKAYCLRRMRGSMADWQRSQDWVPRSVRADAKEIRAAGQDAGLSEAELAEATGLSVDRVRSTLAAVSARPISFEAEPYDVPGEDDVEGQAVVSSVLAAVTAVTSSLDDASRVILVLRYYHGLSIAEAGALAGVTEEEAARLHTDAILAVHDAMVRAVA
jgi:RNA polymerase sigma factor FliA